MLQGGRLNTLLTAGTYGYLTNNNIHFWSSVDDIKHTISVRWSSKTINITYDMLYSNKVKNIDNSF